MELLTWNRAAGRLYDDFRILPEGRRNWAWFVFKYQPRDFFADWEASVRCTLALLRYDYGKYLGVDGAGERLIAELRAEVPLFDAWWLDHEVPDPQKAFNHPSLGHVRYRALTLTLERQPDVRIVVYLPALTPD